MWDSCFHRLQTEVLLGNIATVAGNVVKVSNIIPSYPKRPLRIKLGCTVNSRLKGRNIEAWSSSALLSFY